MKHFARIGFLTLTFLCATTMLSAGTPQQDLKKAVSEVLQILEQAPSFEKAQALLLELRGKPEALKNSPVTRNPQ